MAEGGRSGSRRDSWTNMRVPLQMHRRQKSSSSSCLSDGIICKKTGGTRSKACLSIISVILLWSCREAEGQYRPNTSGGRCYDELGQPQRCTPEFINAAFDVRMDSTNTCGLYEAQEYCVQTGASGSRKSCEICNAAVPGLSHTSEFLTDFNNNENQTWWQSETMLEGVQHPYQINLTLSLGKAFDITYVRLKFYSPRPESFAIYKRTSVEGPWIPYQFYSATCRDTYHLPDGVYLRPGEETRALCTSEFSDISPLTGGNVAFSTLEGRPSAYNFDKSRELQEWVTATDIRVILDRLNTFGDDLFGDRDVLKSYFYAISDIAVGGRCKCNGHASECLASTSTDGRSRLVCRCEHYTAGPDCNECLPFYNDVPWGRATADSAHECKACNCNGYSSRCFFDQELYNRTGHGGHCLDCAGNRDGPNCERCKENFFQRFDGICAPCHCDETGSRSLQCNVEGRCQCKPGVSGDKCNQCEVNHYDFGVLGCKPCGCHGAGSLNNKLDCDPVSGLCRCKENVEGQQCDQCKPGYFQLDGDNAFGCTPCFCYGHSSVCRVAPGYGQTVIESIFARGNERWSAAEYTGRPTNVQYSGVDQNVGVSAEGRDPVYFLAPDRFLNDQRGVYNRDFVFSLHIGEGGPRATVEDIVFEGAGLAISQPIFGQGNPLPTVQSQEYRFKLHESSDYGWTPRLSARDFMSVLANLTAIKIRGTYTSRGIGFLDNVRLETTKQGIPGPPAQNIEMCTCPEGYIGQFCESCIKGFTHQPPRGGPFARCVPCTCNGHAETCDPEGGECICEDNTDGANCERCARGYYGNALDGTRDDCKACPCPNGGACIEISDETVVCLECPVGYTGPRCELCSDGYYGDPQGQLGPPQECLACDCNDNIDPNAVGNCNRTTGECLKCIHNTGGPHCDQCLPGFFGNALALPKGDCKPCECYHPGTVSHDVGIPSCNSITGKCQCKPFVAGINCDRCENGFYDIASGDGCQPCNCDTVGAVNRTCTLLEGQCYCQSGVVGQRCEQCAVNHYGFSYEGCKPCECDSIGSVGLQCNAEGLCPCRDNVEGRRCDRCKENKYNRQAGCVDCPHCYNLVQDAVNAHRAKLLELTTLLGDIATTKTVVDDEDFEGKLREVQARVDNLWRASKDSAGTVGDKSLTERLGEMRQRLVDVERITDELQERLQYCEDETNKANQNITRAEEVIDRARNALKDAVNYLETDGANALAQAVERSERFGRQSDQMSHIARQSRNIAEELESQAELIDKAAMSALNISTQANELAKDAINQQRNISDQIGQVQNDINNTEEKLEQVMQQAAAAQRAASAAHNESLRVYQELHALVIPAVDTLTIKQDALDLKNEATRIKEEARTLLDNHLGLIDDIKDDAELTEVLLQQGLAQQQIADELLADAHAALGRAEEAVSLADKTLKEAQETYTTLQGFDSQVQENKDRAEKAVQEVEQIKDLIQEAEVRTDNAARALDGADRDAEDARDIALEAEQRANESSKAAENIKHEAVALKTKAGNLQDQADQLVGDVAVIMNEISENEQLVLEDKREVSKALEEANKAKVRSQEAATKVQQALRTVIEISQQLNSTKDISNEDLRELEARLRQAEDDFNRENMDERMQQLQIASKQQKQSLKDYEDELEKLRREVDNIEDIKNTLPDDCFKRVTLEP